jgi:hypothetical protein
MSNPMDVQTTSNLLLIDNLQRENQDLKNQCEIDKVKIAVINQSLGEVMNFNSDLKTGNVLFQQQVQKLNEEIKLLNDKISFLEEEAKNKLKK